MSNVTPFRQPRPAAPKKRRKKTDERGVERTPFGFRVWVKVLDRAYSKRFPPDAGIIAMRDWRAAKKTEVLLAAGKKGDAQPAPGTFEEDVQRYLPQVKTMPTFTERAQHLEAWLEALGRTRSRASITPSDIRTVLQRWRTNGRPVRTYTRDAAGKAIVTITGYAPYAESSVNHRRTALQHLFTILDGKRAANPVREVDKFREPDPEPRGLPMDQVRRLLAAMPESATKARAAVMSWTGIPHAQLSRIEPVHVEAQARRVFVTGRHKGRGTKGRYVPLLPEALAAFKLMDKMDAWGKFSRSSFYRSIGRACRAAGIPPIRPYDLRHSFATFAYAAKGDIGAVQTLLDHSTTKMTMRYALGAVNARVNSTIDAMSKELGKKARVKKPRRGKTRTTTRKRQAAQR